MEKSPVVFPWVWLTRLEHLDQRVFHRVFRPGAPPALHDLMRLLSRSADGWLYPLVLLPALFLPGTPGAQAAWAGLLAFPLELLAYRWLKQRLRRPRPCHRLPGVRHLLAPPDEFSFPSGHTAAATVFAILVAAQFPPAAPWLLAWAGGVAVSRVSLGVHYPADVLAGAALGATCANLALRLAPHLLSP